MNDEQTKADLAVAEVESQRFEESRLPVAKPEQPHTLTPAQARVEAVGSVLAKAYAGSSTLQLTPEEVAGLKADFGDDAFKLGAGGNPDLLYIEHAYLRDRFDATIGMGQWALVRSRPHWAEDFTTERGKKAVRIYADCALLIRGCLVSEAIGSMVYYPNNPSQDYSDAAEGSESAAFRRCAKKLGVGLQAWKKDFCAGWMDRHRAASRAPLRQQATHPASSLPERIKKLRVALGNREEYAVGYLRSYTVEGSDANSALLPNEGLDGLRDEQVEWLSRNWPDFLKRLTAYIESVTDDLPMVPVEAVAPQPDPVDTEIGEEFKVLEGYIQASGSKPTKKGGNRWWFATNRELSGDKAKSVYLTTFDEKLAEAIAAIPEPKHIRAAYTEDKWGMKLESVTAI